MPLDLRNLVPAVGPLDADPEKARWTKIIADLEIEPGFVPLVFAKVGDAPYMWHVVYDGVAGGFAPLFVEHSTVQVTGLVHTFSLLPTGGWWESPVAITFGEFKEGT
jgi:hypothetical protein